MDTARDDEFMQLAVTEAIKAKQSGDLPFGAVIVRYGEVVGKGKCENGTTGDVTDHAELIALRDACKTLQRNNLYDCIIYCTNEPCVMCAAGIFQAKIADVRIGLLRSDLPTILRQRKLGIEELAEDSGYKISITKGIQKEKILQLFADLQKKV